MEQSLDRLHQGGLTGPEKAAILILAVGQERAARLCSMLDRHEVVEISRTMLSVGRVDPATVEGLLAEFVERFAEPSGVSGGVAAAQKMLALALGDDEAGAILNEAQGGGSGSVWAELGAINDDVLATYLENEHPQTAALIVSRLASEQAARVLARLPGDRATEVILRLLRMDAVQDEILADVERTLQEELAGSLSGSMGHDMHGTIAAIFNHLDRSTETRLMQSLEDLNKEAADRIRALMFTFDDLGRLEATGIQTLIRATGNDRLARALKGAGEPLRKVFFANMSERAGKMLREEMQSMGPVRLKDVEESQQFMVNIAKELAASGQVILTQAQDEEMVY
jgi:flagellar motor switch protein FliG